MQPLITNVSTVCHDGQGECLWKQTRLTPGEVSSHQCDGGNAKGLQTSSRDTETPAVRPPSPPAAHWRFDGKVMKLWALLCLLFGLLCVWWPRKATRSLLSGAETCSRDIKGDLQTQREKKKIIAQRLLFSGLWSSQSCVILLKFLRRHIKRHTWDYSWCVVRVQSFKQ